MDAKDEIINVDLESFFEENNIVVGENGEVNGLTIDKLHELCGNFLDSVIVGDERYIGVDGFLQNKLSILLDSAINAKEKKEFKEANEQLNAFKHYTKTYLGFEQIDGGFNYTNNESC